MSLLVVGSVAFDGIETPRGSVDRVIGGAGVYNALASSYFTHTRLVGVVGDDFSAEDEELLHRHRIDLEGLERAPGKTFYWKGVYSRDMNERRTVATELNVFAEFRPRLPAAYRDSSHILLGNIQPDLQSLVVEQTPLRQFVGGDTMNYWIERTPDDLAAAIGQWDAILINDQEARQLSGLDNLRAAAKRIQAMGPKTVVIKRGEHGATLFRPDDCFIAPGYPLEDLVDPTGAGDAFAGGFMGHLAACGYRDTRVAELPHLRQAMIYGSVMGSFCCEDFGVDSLLDLSRDQIDERYREFRNLTAH